MQKARLHSYTHIALHTSSTPIAPTTNADATDASLAPAVAATAAASHPTPQALALRVHFIKFAWLFVLRAPPPETVVKIISCELVIRKPRSGSVEQQGVSVHAAHRQARSGLWPSIFFLSLLRHATSPAPEGRTLLVTSRTMTCTLFTATPPPLSSCPPTWHARGEGGGREIRSGILTLVYAPIAAYAHWCAEGETHQGLFYNI